MTGLLDKRDRQLLAEPLANRPVLVQAQGGQDYDGSRQNDDCGFHGIFRSLLETCIRIAFSGGVVK